MAKIVKCKLTYFPIKGKGEPIRLACHFCGMKLDDVRVSREEFQAMREAKEIPFNQLPVAEFFDDEGRSVCKVAQTRAILRTVARASGDRMYSSDLGQAATIDSFLDFEEDLFAAMRSSIFPGRIGMGEYKDDAEKEVRRAHVAETVFTSKLELLDRALSASQTGWVAGTGEPSIADFALTASLGWIDSGIVDGVPQGFVVGKFPSVGTYLEKFAALEENKAYYASEET